MVAARPWAAWQKQFSKLLSRQQACACFVSPTFLNTGSLKDCTTLRIETHDDVLDICAICWVAQNCFFWAPVLASYLNLLFMLYFVQTAKQALKFCLATVFHPPGWLNGLSSPHCSSMEKLMISCYTFLLLLCQCQDWSLRSKLASLELYSSNFAECAIILCHCRMYSIIHFRPGLAIWAPMQGNAEAIAELFRRKWLFLIVLVLC